MIEGWICAILAVLMAAAVLVRLSLGNSHREEEAGSLGPIIGISQTTGHKEIQADVVHYLHNGAGTMAVMADGIGRENTGRLCAQMAVDLILDQYEPYHEMYNLNYFFRSTFSEAHRCIQKTIGDRRGGTSLAAVFINSTHLYYALAGNIQIALMRNGEIIPLSHGQTMDVLAYQAYQKGKLSRQETIWSMEEKRLWNYIGRDGFQEIEICDKPIHLKNGDRVLMLSKGIFEALSWGTIEDILHSTGTMQEMADRIVQAAESVPNPDMENGSVLLLKVKTEAVDETDKFRI